LDEHHAGVVHGPVRPLRTRAGRPLARLLDQVHEGTVVEIGDRCGHHVPPVGMASSMVSTVRLARTWYRSVMTSSSGASGWGSAARSTISTRGSQRVSADRT